MNYIAFFSFVFVTSITPGPNNMTAMAYSGKYGFRKGALFVLGCLIGFFCLMLCCAVFSSVLYETLPAIKPFFLAGGTCYMLYLAWLIWRDKPHDDKTPVKESRIVLYGALLQFINIKVIIYAITVWSTFILPHYTKISALAGWYVFLSCFGPLCAMCWVAVGASFDKVLGKYGKIINAAMSLGLVYCAVTMVVDIFR